MQVSIARVREPLHAGDFRQLYWTAEQTVAAHLDTEFSGFAPPVR
jgi:hypothetical protein